ncbi:MAG TPA: endonuclease/exonuclease/phosphatase family protein [Flavisolibacter sp.]|nr:endonuclease/exonuclease/phosphatase family protein [Flavisolibacter sp.]
MQRNKLKLFLLITCIGIVFIYLLTILLPFLNPGKFWFIAVLGLAYPFLLAFVIIFFFISVAYRSKWLLLPFAALLLSWQQVSALLGTGIANKFNKEKDEMSLRVLSWNVSRWTENKNSVKGGKGISFRNLMMDAIQIENPDVLCLQEFFQCYAPKYFPDNIQPLEKMGYKYYYFSPSSKTVNDLFQTGLAIFSKYPITDSAYFQTISGGHSEGFSYADIKFQDKTMRIFNTHLESIGINRSDYNDIGKTETARSIVSKLKRSYYIRSQQALQLRQEMDRSPYPVIFCGDVDDVPNSYTYFKVKGNMQDAFLKKGVGIGRTFQFVSPTLRIDYMMADKRLNIEQFSKLNYKYSDHYPLLMDVSFGR